jgi:DNA-binding Lrp family transcriptional regulator
MPSSGTTPPTSELGVGQATVVRPIGERQRGTAQRVGAHPDRAGKAGQVAQAIRGIDGVQRAEEVAGPYDIIARVQVPGMDELGRLVIACIQSVDGVSCHPDLYDDPLVGAPGAATLTPAPAGM